MVKVLFFWLIGYQPSSWLFHYNKSVIRLWRKTDGQWCEWIEGMHGGVLCYEHRCVGWFFKYENQPPSEWMQIDIRALTFREWLAFQGEPLLFIAGGFCVLSFLISLLTTIFNFNDL